MVDELKFSAEAKTEVNKKYSDSIRFFIICMLENNAFSVLFPQGKDCGLLIY
jgi:hypothetical protein